MTDPKPTVGQQPEPEEMMNMRFMPCLDCGKDLRLCKCKPKTSPNAKLYASCGHPIRRTGHTGEEVNPIETMTAAVAEHKPVRIYAMFSGGNDSMVSTHLAMKNGAHEVLHINTGIGVEETREFVRETCKFYGWPLREEHPPDKTFRDFVLKYGFPGPGSHRYAYSWLKERALRKVIREVKVKVRDRVMLVTGVRNLESARRMGYVQPIVRDGAKVWVAPMYDFSKLDLHAYRAHHSLPMSQVAKDLGMSGECLCGSFASPGEFERILKFYPKAADQIAELEIDAKLAGVHCRWGTRPKRGGLLSEDLPFMAMCVNCPTKQYLPNPSLQGAEGQETGK